MKITLSDQKHRGGSYHCFALSLVNKAHQVDLNLSNLIHEEV